jgi:hypothetical protein
MNYNQYPYAMFNPAYMNAEYLQQLERQKKEIEQNQKIAEMVKAVKDLCEASRHIQPEYQERAMAACWIELARQIAIDAQGGNL